MCAETKRTVENSLVLFTAATGQDLLTIDRRNFQPQFLRSKIEGRPTSLQLRLQARIWICIAQRLQELLTTQTLLENHSQTKCHFIANVSVVENYLNELKFQQAQLNSQIFKRQVTQVALA